MPKGIYERKKKPVDSEFDRYTPLGILVNIRATYGANFGAHDTYTKVGDGTTALNLKLIDDLINKELRKLGATITSAEKAAQPVAEFNGK